MRKFALPLLLTVLLAACASPKLYYWGSSDGETTLYEKLAYQQYDKQTPEAVCALVCLYEDMVTNPGGLRNVPPPGICAEYGYLLLQPSTAEYFASHATSKQRKVFGNGNFAAMFQERGIQMLAKEMELYPESAKFIGPLLKRAKGGE
jgi:hypothetical protein